jgi:hypothetical protein
MTLVAVGCSSSDSAGMPAAEGAMESDDMGVAAGSDAGSGVGVGGMEGAGDAGEAPSSEGADAGQARAPRADGGAGDAGGVLDAGREDGAGGPSERRCVVDAVRPRPTVMLLIDGSISMEDPYGDTMSDPAPPSRWEAVTDALVGPGGVVTELSNRIDFGIAVYGTQPMCPFPLGIVEPAPGNLAAVQAALPSTPPGLVTPTSEAVEQIVDLLPDPTLPNNASLGSQLIVLATDGDPNGCTLDALGQSAAGFFEQTVAAAGKASAKNLELVVVGLGRDATAQHLQEVANVGAGLDRFADPGATVHSPDPASLHGALGGVARAILGCELLLASVVKPDRVCDGSVTLSGAALECEGPDGYSIREASLTLRGRACDELSAEPEPAVVVDLPCDSVEP